MSSDAKKMLIGAIKDLEDTIEDWQKIMNDIENAKVKAIEELKEIKRLTKKL